VRSSRNLLSHFLIFSLLFTPHTQSSRLDVLSPLLATQRSGENYSKSPFEFRRDSRRLSLCSLSLRSLDPLKGTKATRLLRERVYRIAGTCQSPSSLDFPFSISDLLFRQYLCTLKGVDLIKG